MKAFEGEKIMDQPVILSAVRTPIGKFIDRKSVV
jgi:hypothetical protein